jgi:hypothetical protein
MDFVRKGTCYETEIDFKLIYEPRQSPSKKVSVNIYVEPFEEHNSDDIDLAVPKGVSYNKTATGFDATVDFGQTEEAWIEIMNENAENPNASINLDLPHRKIFEICRALIKGRSVDEYEGWIKDHFEYERAGYHLIKFEGKAEKILNYNNYTKILSIISDENEKVSNVIAGNRADCFRRRILNSSAPIPIDSFEDLATKCRLYNHRELPSSVNVSHILNITLTDIYERVRNSGFEYSSHIITRIYPKDEYDCSILSRQNLALYLACYLRGDRLDESKTIAKNWTNPPDTDSNRPKHELRYEFEKSVSNGNYDDFKINASEYIFQVALYQIQRYNQEGTFPLFDAASELLQSGSTDRDKAEFWARVRFGQINLNNNNSKAREAFQEALAVIENNGKKWSNFDDWYQTAFEGKYEAIVEEFREKEEGGQAVDYLEHLLENETAALKKGSDLELQVEAVRHDLISQQNLHNGSAELSLENLSKAKKLYSELGQHDEEAKLFLRKLLVEAYICELESDFNKASEKYKQASEFAGSARQDRTGEQRYSNLSRICTAKSDLSNNVQKSIEELERIETSNGSIKEERDVLLKLASLIYDFQLGQISHNVQSDAGIKATRADSLIKVKYDFKEPFVVIQAAQFLRNYGFQRSDVLDTAISISLSNALTPIAESPKTEPRENEVSDENAELLITPSSGDIWQSRMPYHIHYQIEKLGVREITHTGDYSDLIIELTKTLEVFLVVICEYYSKFIGNQSRDFEANDSTLNELIDYIKGIDTDVLPVVDKFSEKISNDILPNEEITTLRNTSHHGEDLRYTQEEYKNVRDGILGIFKLLAPYTPVIIETEDGNDLNTYLSIIHWGGPLTRILLQPESQLETGELYYLPPASVDSEHHVRVSKSEIIPCQAERARQASDVHPISFSS